MLVTVVSFSSQPDLDGVVEMLSREATRKISGVFSQLSSLLHNENRSLKARVGQLESQLRTVTGNFENARMWRENVLSGCPVLFEQSGLIYTLKPFGKLKRKTDGETESRRPAGSRHGAGTCPLKDESTQNHYKYILLFF